jgi:prolyl-tRNA editing enzyme YbaK/EbsC (Cys-tRNA(Pro) deacylase)
MSPLVTSASVGRVRDTLAGHGLADRIVELGATARTATDAAQACGVPVGAIVKSLVFEIGGVVVLALVAGDRRCDMAALPAILNLPGPAKRCNAERVRSITGFAIGGVAPVGHLQPLPTAIDASLARFPRLFAAAGHPHCVFATDRRELLALTGGTLSDCLLRQMGEGAAP